MDLLRRVGSRPLVPSWLMVQIYSEPKANASPLVCLGHCTQTPAASNACFVEGGRVHAEEGDGHGEGGQ